GRHTIRHAAVSCRSRGGAGRAGKAPPARAISVHPLEFTSLRAFVLAALGREEEAQAELARIPEARLPAAYYRVRLLRLLHRGAFAEAARLVEQRPADLPISARDEALGDLVQAAARAAPASAPGSGRSCGGMRRWSGGSRRSRPR